MAYEYWSAKNYIRLFALLVLIAVIIIDFIYDADFLRNSASLSVSLQEDGGEWLKTVSEILSSVFTYWIPVLVGVYVLFNKDITYMLYTVTLYLVPYTIVFTLKALYYKGRPFVIDRRVDGCSCDPGMPSGHAIMSMIGYYIVYRFVTDTFWLKSSMRYLYRTILALVCIFLALAVSFSRVVLGAHSYIQLIFAIIIGLNIILYLTYHNFKRVLRYFRGRLRTMALGYGFFLTLFIPTMLYINQEYRNDYDFWRFWGKCPRCDKSFVVGQTQSLGVGYFLVTFYFFFPIKYIIREEDLDLPDPQEQIEERKGLSIILARMGIYIAVVIPAAIAYIIYYVAIRDSLYDLNPIPHGLAVWAVYFIVAGYIGFAVGGLKTWIYGCLHIDNNNDYIDIKYLVNEHKQGALNRPIENMPGVHRHYRDEADIFGRTSAVDDRILRKNQDILDDLLAGKKGLPGVNLTNN